MFFLIKTLKGNKVALTGAFLVGVVFTTAIFVIVDNFYHQAFIKRFLYSPYALDINARLQPPSAKHLLGTDQLGRDLLARVIYGARISIEVGIIAVGLSGFFGMMVGLISGYYGGWCDDIIMRIVDIFLAFPGLILAIAFTGFMGPSLTTVVLALSMVAWVGYARVMRGEVLKVKQSDYVMAAKAIGVDTLRVLFKHVLPNSISPIIVQATMGLGGMIIAEAGLSFLGLGPQPPTPSWGNLLSLGKPYITTAWWLSIFPGLAIFITVMGFNLLGDALRDALDPRLRGSKRL